MPTTPRPADARSISHKITVATLANTGQRVINCWDYWTGGSAVVARHPVNNPAAVLAAAQWAVTHHAHWENGHRVRSVDEVVRTFTR